VQIDIEFSGVCHSDIHTARSEWGDVHLPCVPGHEIVGRVSAVGPEVTQFQTGQRVGGRAPTQGFLYVVSPQRTRLNSRGTS
jgi:D-arabinose 1-dehydrogenase-like Zn-dependent alcohol dehydrogenase